MLRPYTDPRRTLEQFRTYTRSWARPAAEPDAPAFRQWEGDAGPPSHSMPPHLVGKAAATFGRDAFDPQAQCVRTASAVEDSGGINLLAATTEPDVLCVARAPSGERLSVFCS